MEIYFGFTNKALDPNRTSSEAVEKAGPILDQLAALCETNPDFSFIASVVDATVEQGDVRSGGPMKGIMYAMAENVYRYQQQLRAAGLTRTLEMFLYNYPRCALYLCRGYSIEDSLGPMTLAIIDDENARNFLPMDNATESWTRTALEEKPETRTIEAEVKDASKMSRQARRSAARKAEKAAQTGTTPRVVSSEVMVQAQNLLHQLGALASPDDPGAFACAACAVLDNKEYVTMEAGCMQNVLTALLYQLVGYQEQLSDRGPSGVRFRESVLNEYFGSIVIGMSEWNAPKILFRKMRTGTLRGLSDRP